MNCKYCEAELEENTAICKRCGKSTHIKSEYRGQPSDDTKTNKNKSKLIGRVIIAIVSIVALVILIYAIPLNRFAHTEMSILCKRLNIRTSVGDGSVFAIKKMGITYYFKYEDGNLTSTTSADIPDELDAIYDHQNSYDIPENVTVYFVYDKKAALSDAKKALSMYMAENTSHDLEGSMFVVDNRFYFICKNNTLIESTESEMPKTYDIMEHYGMWYFPENVTVYFAEN